MHQNRIYYSEDENIEAPTMEELMDSLYTDDMNNKIKKLYAYIRENDINELIKEDFTKSETLLQKLCKSFFYYAFSDIKLIEILLENGADPNIGHGLISSWEPSHIWDNDYKLLKLLIKYGLDVNLQDDMGKTLMHNLLSTCKQEHIDFNFFYDNGFRMDIEDNNGETPIFSIIKSYGNKFNHFFDIIRVYGINILFIPEDSKPKPIYEYIFSDDEDGYEKKKVEIDYKPTRFLKDNDGNTILHSVIPNVYSKYKELEVNNTMGKVKFLLDNGADIYEPNYYGSTFLQTLMYSTDPELLYFIIDYSENIIGIPVNSYYKDLMFKLMYENNGNKVDDRYIPTDFKLNIITEYEPYIEQGKSKHTILSKSSYNIHKHVLKCKYFDILLNGPFNEVSEATIKMSGKDTPDNYVKYLYTNVIYPDYNSKDLKELADFLDDDNIIDVINYEKEKRSKAITEIYRYEDIYYDEY